MFGMGQARTVNKDKPPGQDRDIWLPHDLIPWGSPVFYAALVLVPLLVWYNEHLDSRAKEENTKLREERLRRRAEREGGAAPDPGQGQE
mmetsp:Transcript_45488/g.91799  ORF Transcript_45488/g.91799 Transcript_45488/m.91799 type:complete len:89 (+) Transcript_45488:215-481(+)